jgi:hypothetical protein
MFHGDGFISWKTANGLSRRDVATNQPVQGHCFFLSFLFVGIHSRPPPLRGIVRQHVDDVKTIYSQKQMSINGGEWKWRLKSNYPTLSGLTPAVGGVVFFGDIGGHFYAVDATNGQRLWELDGAIAGGVIIYSATGKQYVAVATGPNGMTWSTEVTTAKTVILGLGRTSQ